MIADNPKLPIWAMKLLNKRAVSAYWKFYKKTRKHPYFSKVFVSYILSKLTSPKPDLPRLKKMRDELLNLVTLMELELDFSEEDVQFADRDALTVLAGRIRDHAMGLAESFKAGNAVKNGLPVVIVGATNAGKSTLLNTLLGEERAIVSEQHGTTRDTVEECLNIDGMLFRFIDTAGIRENAGNIERKGIERTFAKIDAASVVLAVMDISSPVRRLVESLRAVLGHVDLGQQKLMLLMNKADLYASGDEGGFSEEEFAAAKAEGFAGVTLGKRILRAETAAIAFTSVVMFALGELG